MAKAKITNYREFEKISKIAKKTFIFEVISDNHKNIIQEENNIKFGNNAL